MRPSRARSSSLVPEVLSGRDSAFLNNLRALSSSSSGEKRKELLIVGKPAKFSLTILGKASNFLNDVREEDSSDNISVSSYSDKSSICESPLSAEVADIYQEADSKEFLRKEDNPLHILKAAAEGDIEELTRIVNIDPAKLLAQDHRGQNIVHHAAMWSRIEILDYLYDFVDIQYADLNDEDKLGNTPMHFAVERNQMAVLDWLLDHGANIRAKNMLNQAPIHVAVEMGLVEMIERMIDKDPEIVYFPGDLGFTPLLYACKHDRPEVARALLLKGADLMQFCDVGYSAIHAATRNGCSKIVDVLIEFAERQGISGTDLIHTLDKELNLPLHAAINSGDLKAVEVCLKAGADITAPRAEDKQSPVHYAAAKGALDLIKAMFEAQPEKIENCVAQRDILDQAPLHKAAMFNHTEVVKYLLDNNSSINCQDEERRTPLVLAASKNAVKVVNLLLSRRANVSMRDKDNRNFLHMAILTGMKLKNLEIKSLKTLKVLLNERDDFGCCPAHYASKAGQLATLKGLMQLGAQMTLKDNDKKNPLHVACRYGRIRSVKGLLASEHGKMLVTEIDNDGHNALHISAIYGQAKIVALLLSRGAQLNKDFALNTILHLAAENGSYSTVVLLLGLAPHLLNQQNRVGNTALHLAANNGHALVVDYLLSAQAELLANSDGASFIDMAVMRDQKDIVAAVIRHMRCEEVMRLPSVFGMPIIGLVQHLPAMCLLYLDKCVVYSTDSRKSDNFFVQHNFRCLMTPEEVMSKRFEKVGKAVPLWPLNMMVRFNRVDCLAHPLCVAFLDQKWNSYGSLIYNLRIAVFIVSLFILTSIVFDVDDVVIEYERRRKQSGYNNDSLEPFFAYLPNNLFIRMVIMTAFSLYNIVGIHAVSMAQQKLPYFFDITNYIDLAFYVPILLVTLPSLTGYPNLPVQFNAGVVSLFFGWLDFLMQMQRFDYFGLYIVMFLEILKTVLRALIVFAAVGIAFAFSMTLVFRRHSGRTLDFSSPFMTIITILPMMVGDINYSDYLVPSFDNVRENQTLVPPLAALIFACFIVIMSILVKNILIGLAVGNIESVQKNARLKRLAIQVIYFTDLERRLPRRFLKNRQVCDYKFFPNRKVIKFWESMKGIIGLSKQSTSKGIVEGFGGEDAGDEAAELEYVQQQLLLQGRRLTALVSRYEMHRAMMKAIYQKFDTEICNDGKRAEHEIESGDEDNDGDDPALSKADADDSGTVFRSPASNAMWHQLNKRFSNLKKPQTNIWLEDEDQEGDGSTTEENSNMQQSAVGKVL